MIEMKGWKLKYMWKERLQKREFFDTHPSGSVFSMRKSSDINRVMINWKFGLLENPYAR